MKLLSRLASWLSGRKPPVAPPPEEEEVFLADGRLNLRYNPLNDGDECCFHHPSDPVAAVEPLSCPSCNSIMVIVNVDYYPAGGYGYLWCGHCRVSRPSAEVLLELHAKTVEAILDSYRRL